MDHKSSQCRVVSQPGVVTAVHGTDADIQIVQTSACASCRLRGVCSPGDAATKIVQAPNRGGLHAGMQVEVQMEERWGWLGVLLAFVVPLAVVVGILFGLAPLLGSQERSAMVGLAALLPYYGLLYITRNLFAQVVQFEAVPRDAAALSPPFTMVDTSAFHKEGVQ